MIKLISRAAIIFLVLAMLGAGALGYVNNGSGDQPERDDPGKAAENESFALGPGAEALAEKNETVYVLLNEHGSPLEQRIVNRIYGCEDSAAGYIADYGAYLSVQNMAGPDQPLLKEDRVLWPANLLESGDIYYEGVLSDELPLSIEISYYLDGDKVDPLALPGQSGRLELELVFTNRLRYEELVRYTDYNGNTATGDEEVYVPLLVQGSLELDLERYSNIEHEDSLGVVIGQQASINFMAFPYPQAEVRIAMDADNIELERINFMVVPQLPALPEIDLEEALLMLLDGFKPLSEGLAELSKGADLMLAGLRSFQEEAGSGLADSAELAALLAAYLDQRESYAVMAETFDPLAASEAIQYLAGLPTQDLIPREPDHFSAELLEARGSLANLETGFSSMSSSLEALAGMALVIQPFGQRLVSENPPGTELHQLGELLLSAEQEIEQALAARNDSLGALEELDRLLSNLDQNWFEYYYPGLSALEDVLRRLEEAGLPGSLPELLLELEQLEQFFEEIDRYLFESTDLLLQLDQLPFLLDRVADGQLALRDGLNELGLSGFAAMEAELIDAVNQSREAKARLDLMSELAASYRSYADNENNLYSEVRFVMQTPRLQLESESDDEHWAPDEFEEEHWAALLWERLVDLFD